MENLAQKKRKSLVSEYQKPSLKDITHFKFDKDDTAGSSFVPDDSITQLEPKKLKYTARSYQLTFKDKIIKFRNSNYVKCLDIISTLWALFADDIKLIATTKDTDYIFSSIAICVMAWFTIEIGFSFIIHEDHYGFSVFFWMDLFGVTSMILDIHWISNTFISQLFGTDSNFNKDKGQSFVQLSRGIRIIIRSARIFRIIRVGTLMKYAKGNNNSPAKKQRQKEEHFQVLKKFDELTFKRIMILVFLMIIANIFFDSTFYYRQTGPLNFGLSVFEYMSKSHEEFRNLTFNVYMNTQETSYYPILYAKVYNIEVNNMTYLDSLRITEKNQVVVNCSDPNPHNHSDTDTLHDLCILVFDCRPVLKLLSVLNIVKTFFVCFVMVIGILGFSRDTYVLAFAPIKKMTAKIKNLSKNPIAALQQNFDLDNAKASSESKSTLCNQIVDAPLETTLLEKTITKICGLLALGYGEAGAEIISTVMNEGIEAEMNPMIPGKKIFAIYGFCDIRNFTDTTEVLQEKVMIFVNEVAEIVHEITSDYMGSANKNIGDAFLLVWKIEDRFVEHQNGELVLKQCREVNQIVDMALISFLKIIFKIRRSSKLAEYKKHEGLNKRMANYSVKLGFGMHLGYSIEGAIGSMYKIDASYLSPNVNMASMMEERTKEYGKDIILSGEFVKFLSEEARHCVRQVDIISCNSTTDGVLSNILK